MKRYITNKRSVILLMGAVVLLFSSFIVFIFGSLYRESQDNIVNIWRSDAILFGQEISYFAADGVEAMDFTAKQVNRMDREGASRDEILAYLEEESEVYPEAVAGNTNGVYACYKGEFLSGAGWVPGDGFEPQKRPWYREAMDADGSIVLVRPYTDLNTGNVITTVAKRLDDGESVLGIDVELTDIQQLTEKAIHGTSGGSALVLDHSGHVVAHSDVAQVGEDFKKNNSGLWKALNRELKDNSDKGVTFRIQDSGRSYLVFAELVSESWITAMVLDEGKIFQSLRYIYMASALALIVVITVLLIIFLYTLSKIAQADELRYLSETDKLTGINNRGAGEEKISRLLQAGENGMFILIDVDHFKSVNDNFGHDVGDKVIIVIAECLKSCFRESDVVLRLGGDEFAAYARGVSDQEIGERLLGRFFEKVDAIDIPELGDRKICVSIGASFYRGKGSGFSELYKKADEGTYISKKTEGNQMTFRD